MFKNNKKLIHMDLAWNILVQYCKTSMKKIVRKFEQYTKFILLGTEAFWAQISYRGRCINKCNYTKTTISNTRPNYRIQKIYSIKFVNECRCSRNDN